MKKKIFILLLFICNIGTVNANSYYLNSNGIKMSMNEYNFINELYEDDYAKIISIDEYNTLKEYKLFNRKIVKNSNISNYSLYSTEHKTAYKKITISKVCNNECLVTLKIEWLKIPNLKSWDVIGMRIEGVSLLDIKSAGILNDKGNNKTYTNPKKFNNGFGYSVKLLDGKSVLRTTALVSKGGTVYGSYQHAKSSVSEEQSKNYTINNSGLGRVFDFKNGIASKYDNMQGVSIDL